MIDIILFFVYAMSFDKIEPRSDIAPGNLYPDRLSDLAANLENNTIKQISETIHGKNYIYNTSGDPSGPVMIHLHGLVGSKDNFRAQMEDPLLQGYHHIAFDLHTDVQDNKKITDIDGLTEYIQAFLGYKQYSDIALHGVSLGGEIAYKFAATYPNLISKLILSGASGLQHENLSLGTANFFAIMKDKTKLQEKIKEQFAKPESISIEVINGLTNDIQGLFKSRAGLAWTMAFAKHSTKAPIEKNKAILQTIGHIPTYLLWGSEDKITPFELIKDGFSTALNLPEDRIHLFASGHTPNIECPAEYNKILQSIFKKS